MLLSAAVRKRVCDVTRLANERPTALCCGRR